jgi:hypothetical protein
MKYHRLSSVGKLFSPVMAWRAAQALVEAYFDNTLLSKLSIGIPRCAPANKQQMTLI